MPSENVRKKAEKVKDIVLHALGGIIVVAILAFSFGWIVTGESAASKAREASINAYASVCAKDLVASWTAQGNKADALDEWENREKIEKLAASLTADLPIGQKLEDEVVDACEEKAGA